MCPPTRRSCKNRDLWRTHEKTAQQNVRAEVSLTPFFEASQHFLFFSPPYTTAPKSSGALLNRPQSLLGGRKAMKTKAHHRSWQQRSTQYPSKMKLYSFRMTKRQGAWSRNERKFVKSECFTPGDLCQKTTGDATLMFFILSSLCKPYIFIFLHFRKPNEGWKKVLCSANHLVKKQKSLRCQHYSNLWNPK